MHPLAPHFDLAERILKMEHEAQRVLIVDDQESMRQALRKLLGGKAAFQLCGEACDGYEALQRARELGPHVILMDITMPGLNGLEAARRIHKDMPEAEILILTQHESLQAARAAKEVGARGYLSKTDAAQHLVTALEAVCKHLPFFPASV